MNRPVLIRAAMLRLGCFCLAAAMVLAVLASTPGHSEPAPAGMAPVRTDSPRQTIESFLMLRDELESALLAYRENRTRAVRERITRIGEEFLSLIDLTSVPDVSRRQRGVETSALLLDILGRIDLPARDDIPDADQFDPGGGKPARWRIPGTPVEIGRMKDGPREGEFLFTSRTVDQADRFYREIAERTLRSRLPIANWGDTISQLTGPLIPLGVVSAIPDFARQRWLDTPIWKVIGSGLVAVLVLAAILAWNRAVRPREPHRTPSTLLRRLLTPVALLVLVAGAEHFIRYELNIAGDFATIVASAVTVIEFAAAAWIVWLAALMLAEIAIRSPSIPDQSFDASLLRLCARIAGVVGGVAILTYGANLLGIPVYSLVAGLGIGGLAVALAVRPTLENLIGGLILYADRPVRVGDYCSFNNHVGTIESIGVRSTQIRARDRTLISVPNAKFADMEIINWAHCDTMLIHAVIGLRYETAPDQLRFVLARLREMLCAHPKIQTDKVRVSFVGFGASSLDIEIRVFALTREWNEFHAIREDVFLRVAQIVADAGTGFAFPSRSLYVQRDQGLDQSRGERAAAEVEAWRNSGTLPFPHMPQSRVDELSGTLDYPPRGSPDFMASSAQEAGSEERLSDPDESGAESPQPPGEAPNTRQQD